LMFWFATSVSHSAPGETAPVQAGLEL
jgi:hypothetical protein